MKRLCARDRDALGRFYELFFDRIHGYIRRMLGEDHVAEDVTHDVFMHIQRSIDTYDRSRELSPWVFAIATNKVRDHWRSRRHKDTLRESSLDDENAAVPIEGRGGPLPALENDELRETLSAAIDALPESLRTTLVLRWNEEMSFEDIGVILERNEAAVRKRYSRALEELRTALEVRFEARTKGSR